MNTEETKAWIVFPHVFPKWFACHITKSDILIYTEMYTTIIITIVD